MHAGAGAGVRGLAGHPPDLRGGGNARRGGPGRLRDLHGDVALGRVGRQTLTGEGTVFVVVSIDQSRVIGRTDAKLFVQCDAGYEGTVARTSTIGAEAAAISYGSGADMRKSMRLIEARPPRDK